jgi:hypothetical protein
MKHENENIEELLNSFIDGELTEKEQTRVKQLVSRNADVARRLRELRNSKMLVSSLPREEAPAQILENVKVLLEIGTQSVERSWSQEPSDSRKGARHLMFRKVLAAAAMVGLVAVLSMVVYTIVAPEPVPEAAVPALAFDGRLELKTNALSTVNEFIKKAIEDNGLSNSIRIERHRGTHAYSITCSRENLKLLLSDLAEIWEKCNSKTLLVNTKTPGGRKFDDVSNNQLITIVNDLITPVKPAVTTGEEVVERMPDQQGAKKQVHLSIIVTGSD